MKDVELRLIAELMKNSRRSDRELARALGVSQPTISRMIRKLEKEGYIKEYTIIPDFSKLGYEIMGITSIHVHEQPSKEGFKEIKRMTAEVEKRNPHAFLMAVNGLGNNKNRLFITFYEDYDAYGKAMNLTRQLPFADVESLESFLVNLKDETNYRLLSMSAIAEHLVKKSQKKP
jgi:DNA-binding Lrp family transcriptional regulator